MFWNMVFKFLQAYKGEESLGEWKYEFEVHKKRHGWYLKLWDWNQLFK